MISYQVWKYCEGWRDGPVMLVLCETQRGFDTGMLTRHVAALRGNGHSGVVAAAGRRLR